MIEMSVEFVRVSMQNYNRVVILKEKESERYLLIWIGPAEAEAIAMRFTPPGEGASVVVVIDAGFQESGDAFVQHIAAYFGTKIDLALLTHPDGDHIGRGPVPRSACRRRSTTTRRKRRRHARRSSSATPTTRS